MQQLATEGAVEVVPNRGFRVTVRSARELAELAEVRALIEIPVMLRLARTIPAARWSALRPSPTRRQRRRQRATAPPTRKRTAPSTARYSPCRATSNW